MNGLCSVTSYCLSELLALICMLLILKTTLFCVCEAPINSAFDYLPFQLSDCGSWKIEIRCHLVHDELWSDNLKLSALVPRVMRDLLIYIPAQYI